MRIGNSSTEIGLSGEVRFYLALSCKWLNQLNSRISGFWGGKSIQVRNINYLLHNIKVFEMSLGFRGSACSLNEGQTPTVTGSLPKNCDIRSFGGNSCLQVSLQVDASDALMTCRVRVSNKMQS